MNACAHPTLTAGDWFPVPNLEVLETRNTCCLVCGDDTEPQYR